MSPTKLISSFSTYLAAIGLILSAGCLLAQPLDTVLVLETTPGAENATGLIRAKHFPEADRVAVVGFSRSVTLYQSLTDDQEELAAALQKCGARLGVALGGGEITQNLPVNLTAALTNAIADFGRHSDLDRSRAIILLFAGEDLSFSSRMAEIEARLTSAKIRLYAVQVYRTEAGGRNRPAIPSMRTLTASTTALQVSQLAKLTGGKFYPRNWDLKEILAEARRSH
jgi:hypothetical protein